MGSWTSQNWTKRDERNNQQQEKKATYKTAAELAVKNLSGFFTEIHPSATLPRELSEYEK